MMLQSKSWLKLVLLAFLCPLVGVGCTTTPTNETTSSEAPESATETTETTASQETSQEKGTLALVANGEDFVRQGFVTKDGWEIQFDRVYVTLADVTAYQTDPPFDPEKDTDPKAVEEVVLVEEATTVDLAEGDENAEAIAVTQVEAVEGQYNSLEWTVVPAESGEAEGSAIALQGTATKDGETLDFTINIEKPLSYTCGEFVGDDRKGILKAEDEAELETTFHFDHIFGDGEAAPDDEINTGAVGFEPFAQLAENNTIDVNLATLETALDADTYTTLQEAIIGLGHVGEGHCRELATAKSE